MSFGKKLSSIFKTAALTAAVSMSSAYCYEEVTLPGDPLTEHEDALTERIYGEKVDTMDVRKLMSKHAHPKGRPNTVATAQRDFLLTFYDGYHSRDYALEDDVDKFGIFNHEILHIWQYQNWKGRQKSVKDCNVYSYHYLLDGEHDFYDLCVEQQAAAMEDYTRRFLHAEQRSSWIFNEDDTDKHLREMIEPVFPKARKARLAFARKNNLTN